MTCTFSEIKKNHITSTHVAFMGDTLSKLYLGKVKLQGVIRLVNQGDEQGL